jgi:pyruvate, orthophosphate dikinase
MFKSRALEVNLARTQVEVVIDPHYSSLLEVMAPYYGLLEGLNTFLKEVSHPYKNWQFIVAGARGYALDYFHLMRPHPQGAEAAERLIDIFFKALDAETATSVKVDAADNLIVFLEKIIKTVDSRYIDFEPLIRRAFERIHLLPDKRFELFVRSFYGLKRLGLAGMAIRNRQADGFAALNRLLMRYLEHGFAYWLAQEDPLEWFSAKAEGQISSVEGIAGIFAPVTRATLERQRGALERIRADGDLASRQVLEDLCRMTDHPDMVQVYRRIPEMLLAADGRMPGNQWKALFLFHIMKIEWLALVHEDALRDINRTLSWLIANQNARYIQNLVRKTFAILEVSARNYPATALTCVLNMGKGIFRTDDGELIDAFITEVIELGFQTPQIGGVGNDWQIQVNNAHIQNIRIWLELAGLQPRSARRLLSNLIIHLAVSGVFIRDTDLFGRDITRLLNSDIAPVYNLIKQLARLFPVYFNDIGAEGELRDISTRVDEMSHRRDPLIHFLRKQSHVEGSNRILNLMEAVMHFWATRDKTQLAPFLPPNIYEQVEVGGPHIDGVHRVVAALLAEEGIEGPEDILAQSEPELRKSTARVSGVTDIDRERVVLFVEFHKQLNNKYNLDFKHLRHYVEQLSQDVFPRLDVLRQALDEPDLTRKLAGLLDYLEILKAIILSFEKYEIRENIYKKRHFTVDIPSMYGSYHEPKFDAMGLTLRIESLVNVLFEELIDAIDLSFITKATCYQIHDRLKLFDRVLKIDGIASAELARQLDLLAHSLEIRGFSFTQYLDIFKGFAQAVNNAINDHFNTIHGEHLTRILECLPMDHILPKFRSSDCALTEDRENLCHRTSEIFFRDRLATSPGLPQLDLFLSRILNVLFHQSNQLPREKLHLLLNYDPGRALTCLHPPNPLAGGIIYLGNKGLNLVRLKQLGMPVPAGFIITTEVYRCREIIDTYPPALENFKTQVARKIRTLEHLSGRRFGDPRNPLLLSVRSGSSISQPGMMVTFLNVGMNESIAEGLAAHSGNAWFAWDCYRRFLQCFGMGLGMRRDEFDAIIGDYKKSLGIPLKREFSGAHMREVALAYRNRILQSGFPVPDNPLEQLHQTIRSVMDSWKAEKAEAYRQIMGISDDWGTAITVQTMVFGNWSNASGAGVIFTHNPRWSGESLSLWGDFTVGNQGEDVVAGLVRTLPISIKQQEIEMRETDITLETHFPEIYDAMLAWVQDLVFRLGWSPQEMEFTFESPAAKDLYLLQTRDMTIRERKHVLAFDPESIKEQVYLGHGIGVSAGALSGRLVFSLEEVAHWRAREPGTALILARADTVPDDIKEIFAADGLLTARGGVTSHAAVVAHRLGKACVVGCGDMICDEIRRVVHFGERRLRSGECISIDGREGSVYQGCMRIKAT